MKWFIRQFVDGSMDTLTRLLNQGLSYPANNVMMKKGNKLDFRELIFYRTIRA